MSAWTLPKEVFFFLRRRLAPMSAVVELGSGEGTAALVEMFGRVHTVEHDEAFVGKVSGAHYIHAPIKGGWYDADALADLPPVFDCLVVDGPPGAIGRAGLVTRTRLWERGPVVIDDTHRRQERDMAAVIAHARNEAICFHHLPDARCFATIGFPWALHPQTVAALTTKGASL